MDRIDLYRIFVRVVDCASFTRAAATLGMPRSSVSAAIQELEARLGVRLLNRTTRRVAPTQDGLAFHDRCARLVEEAAELEAQFRPGGAAPGGRLRIDMPGRIGRLVVAPALPGFLERYPRIEVILGVTDRAVNLIEEGADCVVRVGAVTDPSLAVRPLGDVALINVASPAYLARHGVPLTPDDLDGHQMVRYASPVSGRVDDWEWTAGGRRHGRPLPGRVTVNGAEAYIACALAGLGMIQIPAYDVRSLLAAGELVEVMPRHRSPPMPLSLLFPSAGRRTRRLQALVDWLEALLAGTVLAPA